MALKWKSLVLENDVLCITTLLLYLIEWQTSVLEKGREKSI